MREHGGVLGAAPDAGGRRARDADLRVYQVRAQVAGVSVIPDAGEFAPVRAAFAPDAVGKHLKLRGWILRSRSSGGILFFRIRDRTGDIQVTARKEAIGAEKFDAVEHVQIEGAVLVAGTVAADARAPGGR